jgi:hypothetical protein
MMTDLEDRLRRDLTTYAGRATAENIRGLQPASDPHSARRARQSRARRWLAPTGAAVAVAAIALAATLLVVVHGSTTTSPSAAVSAPHPGLPRFYVAVVQNPSGAKYATTAVVHDSATGATLAKVPVQTLYAADGSSSGPGITAAADDRTYLLTETNGSGPDHWQARFYLLRVAADGRSATVRKVPISWPRTLAPDQQAALSPDGTQLAMDVQACYVGGCHYSGVRVITIATGAVRSWTTHVQGAPFQLSWAGNSRIAFEWQSSSKTPPPSQRTGYRLLDVSGQGGDLLSGPAVATPATTATGSMPAALVTPDGSRVITSMTTAHRDGLLTDTVVGKVIELDAQTGKLLRVLATTTVTGASRNENSQNSAASLEQGCDVLSLAPRGLNVLASCFRFGRFGISGFTPLAGSAPAWDGGAYAW